MGTTSNRGGGRSPRWWWVVAGIGIAAAGALWIFAATLYGQMRTESDWHMAGPVETLTFAEAHGIGLYAPGGVWPGSDSEVESAQPNVCAQVTHTYPRVAGEDEIFVSASPASCGGPGGYLGSDDTAGRRTLETPVGRAVLGDYEQPEARIDTPTTSLFVGSLSGRIVPDDVFADFVRSLRAVEPGA